MVVADVPVAAADVAAAVIVAARACAVAVAVAACGCLWLLWLWLRLALAIRNIVANPPNHQFKQKCSTTTKKQKIPQNCRFFGSPMHIWEAC
jgi:1,4-dihydroxy-2-naphthoate octaprenyltransferase